MKQRIIPHLSQLCSEQYHIILDQSDWCPLHITSTRNKFREVVNSRMLFRCSRICSVIYVRNYKTGGAKSSFNFVTQTTGHYEKCCFDPRNKISRKQTNYTYFRFDDDNKVSSGILTMSKNTAAVMTRQKCTICDCLSMITWNDRTTVFAINYRVLILTCSKGHLPLAWNNIVFYLQKSTLDDI